MRTWILPLMLCSLDGEIFLNFWFFLGDQEKERTVRTNWSAINFCYWPISIWRFPWRWNSAIQRWVSWWWINFSNIWHFCLQILFEFMSKMNSVTIVFSFFVWRVDTFKRKKKTEEAYCLAKVFLLLLINHIWNREYLSFAT